MAALMGMWILIFPVACYMSRSVFNLTLCLCYFLNLSLATLHLTVSIQILPFLKIVPLTGVLWTTSRKKHSRLASTSWSWSRVWIEDALTDVNASFLDGRPMWWWKHLSSVLHCLFVWIVLWNGHIWCWNINITLVWWWVSFITWNPEKLDE